jgi:hypothetical protein
MRNWGENVEKVEKSPGAAGHNRHRKEDRVEKIVKNDKFAEGVSFSAKRK